MDSTSNKQAQNLMNQVAFALNVAPLTARLEHEPKFYGQYWMFADTLNYKGIDSRVVVTIYVDPSQAPRIGFYTRSDKTPLEMGYSWGIDCDSVQELLERVSGVVDRATNEDSHWRNMAIARHNQTKREFEALVDSGEIQRRIDECKWALAEIAENEEK